MKPALLMLCVLVLVLVGCGAKRTKWIDVHVMDTTNNPGQGPCYKATNPDRTVQRIICSGQPGVGTCYAPESDDVQSNFTVDKACVAAREAIEKHFRFHF